MEHRFMIVDRTSKPIPRLALRINEILLRHAAYNIRVNKRLGTETFRVDDVESFNAILNDLAAIDPGLFAVSYKGKPG